MPVSSEAKKYQDEFTATATKIASSVATGEYKNDLDLIKAINRSIEDLQKVRTKHVRS